MMNTSELIDVALDWAVTVCEGKAQGHPPLGERRDLAEGITPYGVKVAMHYSSDWVQGGPIIEREGVCTAMLTKQDFGMEPERYWVAHIDGIYCRYGPTPLIAAMRCYVVSKLGDEVEIPKELT